MCILASAIWYAWLRHLQKVQVFSSESLFPERYIVYGMKKIISVVMLTLCEHHNRRRVQISQIHDTTVKLALRQTSVYWRSDRGSYGLRHHMTYSGKEKSKNSNSATFECMKDVHFNTFFTSVTETAPERFGYGAESRRKAWVRGWASTCDDWKTLSVNPAVNWYLLRIRDSNPHCPYGY